MKTKKCSQINVASQKINKNTSIYYIRWGNISLSWKWLFQIQQMLGIGYCYFGYDLIISPFGNNFICIYYYWANECLLLKLKRIRQIIYL